MIRQYPETITAILLYLLEAKACGINPLDYDISAGNFSEDQIETLSFARSSLSSHAITLDQIIEELIVQIEQNDLKESDADLVDTIVRILQLPYARQMLSGEGLKQLRRAILLPEEASGLLARLEQLEKTCATCGHTFQGGELMVLKERNTDRTFHCTKCVSIHSMACERCGNTVEVQEVKHVACEACSGEQATPRPRQATQAPSNPYGLGGGVYVASPASEPDTVGPPRPFRVSFSDWARGTWATPSTSCVTEAPSNGGQGETGGS